MITLIITIVFAIVAYFGIKAYKESIIKDIFENHPNTDADKEVLRKMSIEDLKALVPKTVR